mgnify:CR=1 FL=1
MLSLESRDWFDVRLLKLSGVTRLDFERVRAFSAEFRTKTADVRWVVLDLTDVATLDSSALGALVRFHLKLDRKQGGLRLAGVSDGLRSLLQITRLEAAFPIYPGVEEALESFLGKKPTAS